MTPLVAFGAQPTPVCLRHYQGYSTGSSQLAYGSHSSPWRPLVVGALITGILSLESGMSGEIYHVGFIVTARMMWGMESSQSACAFAFASAGSYWGEQAGAVVLDELLLSFENMAWAIPASSQITTQMVGPIV
ncbi:hypothetical protein Q5752_004385 [Cryptotrichosporon argae]